MASGRPDARRGGNGFPQRHTPTLNGCWKNRPTATSRRSDVAICTTDQRGAPALAIQALRVGEPCSKCQAARPNACRRAATACSKSRRTTGKFYGSFEGMQRLHPRAQLLKSADRRAARSERPLSFHQVGPRRSARHPGPASRRGHHRGGWIRLRKSLAARGSTTRSTRSISLASSSAATSISSPGILAKIGSTPNWNWRTTASL